MPLRQFLWAEARMGLQTIFGRVVGTTGSPRACWQFMARGLEHLRLGQCMRCGPGKVLEAEHEVTRVHQDAREAAGGLVLCWGSEAASCPSEELGEGRAGLLTATRSRGPVGAHKGTGGAPAPRPCVRLLLWARMPKSCVCSGDKSQW